MGWRRHDLVELLRISKELGFDDDIAHWTSELEQYDTNNQGATQ